MSHEIDMSNGRANMAYRGQKPWHGLGFEILPGDSPEVIAKKAGLNFTIEQGKMLMQTKEGKIIDASDLNRSIFYRSDTEARLSVMSTTGYHVVQPAAIMDFIASSAKAMGWGIETAGSLKGGKKIWALANTGNEADVGVGDRVKGYLLAATACDGSMASEFLFTSVCVVCNNTLQMALEKLNQKDGERRVKVYHYNTLDVAAVKKQLGIADTVWKSFIERAKDLTRIHLSEKKAIKVLRKVYEPEVVEAERIEVTDEDFMKSSATARALLDLYQGQGIGMDLKSRKGTAWGLVNAATEFYDHASKTRSVDNRLNSAWFGGGAAKKQEIVDACFEVAA